MALYRNRMNAPKTWSKTQIQGLFSKYPRLQRDIKRNRTHVDTYLNSAGSFLLILFLSGNAVMGVHITVQAAWSQVNTYTKYKYRAKGAIKGLYMCCTNDIIHSLYKWRYTFAAQMTLYILCTNDTIRFAVQMILYIRCTNDIIRFAVQMTLYIRCTNDIIHSLYI